jgi:hypothetical protein
MAILMGDFNGLAMLLLRILPDQINHDGGSQRLFQPA